MERLSFDTPDKQAALRAALLELAHKLHARGIQIAPNTGDEANIKAKMKFVGFVEAMPGFKPALLHVEKITISRNGAAPVETIVPADIRNMYVWVDPV